MTNIDMTLDYNSWGAIITGFCGITAVLIACYALEKKSQQRDQ